ncbi:MAG: hypothetical protein WD773_12685 [Gemmatimonadales bacterium]
MLGIAGLRFASSLLVPIVVAVLLTLLLGPLVRGMRRYGVAEGVGAAMIVFGTMSLFGIATVVLAGLAGQWLRRAPETLRQVEWIARAILHDPRILILDEATSSVDTETEREIQQALERLVSGRTVFAIAHRLSTLRKASRLFVVEDGRLVESGTHAELLAKPEGKYRRLYELQLQLQ